MATTTYGTEYVQSSDLVSNWPGSSLNVANRIDNVSLVGNGLNNQTGTSYTLVLTDGGKNVTLNNASAVSLTIPTNASVAFPTGVSIGLVNKGAGTVTVAGAGGVTLTGTSLTLAQNETAFVIKLDTNTWQLYKASPGKVLQVVQATYATRVDTTSTSFVTSGLTASITPSSTASKVLIMVHTTGRNTSTSHVSYYTLFRGTVSGTNLGSANEGMISLYGSGDTSLYATVAMHYLDSPSTTSSQTYTLGFRTANAAGGASTQMDNTTASMILMEIAA